MFTSDLNRAIETSNIVFPEITKITDSRLRECNYENLEGKNKSFVIYEEHVTVPFPNGESLEDVEKRMREFINYLQANYSGKTIGIVAHRATQLALEVIMKGISWEEANAKDWRKTGNWQPGWEYIIKD